MSANEAILANESIDDGRTIPLNPNGWAHLAFSTVVAMQLCEPLVFRIDRQQGPAHVEFRKRMAQHPLLKRAPHAR